MEILPANGLTLREACLYFGADGQPLPRTTLRDIIQREGLRTLTERRQSGRGLRTIVVLPAESLRRIAEIVGRRSPIEPDETFRQVRQDETAPDASVGASLVIRQDAELEIVLSRQAARIAELEALVPPVVVEWWQILPWTVRLVNAARSPIAVRAVLVCRVVCCAVLWLCLPERVALSLSPTRTERETAEPLRYRSNRAKANKLRGSA